MYRVALVGHSNLPTFPGWDNVQVEVFKVRGAKLTDLIDHQRFSGALFTTHWDCVVLFLGGNDIAGCQDPDVLFRRHEAAFRTLRTNRLIITDLEPRTYDRQAQNTYGISSHRYNAIAKLVNKRLKRFVRRTPNANLIHIPPGFMEQTRDGIHLSPTGERDLIRRYKGCILAFQ